MHNITLSKDSLSFLMKHRNSSMNQSSAKPAVSFSLNANDSSEESDMDEVVHYPELMRKAGLIKKQSNKQVGRISQSHEKASGSISKTISSPTRNRKPRRSAPSFFENEDIDSDDTFTLEPPEKSRKKKGYASENKHTSKTIQVSSNVEHEVPGKRIPRTQSKSTGASKGNFSPSKKNGCAPELKTYGNKRQQKSASSLASKSLDSPMQLVQHSDATHSQSQSSVSEIDDLYSPLSNRTTLRGNRSNPVVKTTDVQKLSRSANRELDGIYHLETVPTNLSQRFSSFQKSTPERIIQLAYETSGNQSTSTTDTRTKKTKENKRTQATDWFSPDPIPSPVQNDPIEFETRHQRHSRRHPEKPFETVSKRTETRGMSPSAALYPTQALKSPTILQTPVKAPRIRQIQSLNIISSPRMSSFNVISGGRAPSPDSSISDESLQGVSLTPSRKLMPAPKKRKSSGLQLDFSSSTKKSRTSASANERSHHSMENIATDTDEVSDEVVVIPSKSEVSALTPSSAPSGRFDPYLASVKDPFRAMQLLLNENFCVHWLELSPRCIFTFKTYAPSTVMIVAGTITMKSQQSERNVTLDSSNPIAYLKVGALYHVFNSANVTAIYQLTETLKKL